MSGQSKIASLIEQDAESFRKSAQFFQDDIDLNDYRPDTDALRRYAELTRESIVLLLTLERLGKARAALWLKIETGSPPA